MVCLQVEEMREDHEASLVEMEMTHGDTLATLQEEHARTVKSKKNSVTVPQTLVSSGASWGEGGKCRYYGLRSKLHSSRLRV